MGKKGLSNKKFKFTVTTPIPYVGMGVVYKVTKNDEYLQLMIQQAEYLVNDAPRLNNGAIRHKILSNLKTKRNSCFCYNLQSIGLIDEVARTENINIKALRNRENF